MPHSIYVFSQKRIKEFDPDEILEAVTESNFHTLCGQYGLDLALIQPAFAYLKVLSAAEEVGSFFVLAYQPANQRPIIVNRLDVKEHGHRILEPIMGILSSEALRSRLSHTREILSVELDPVQLRDLGLLFGYELARWAAFKGEGIVRALDGQWYRLNRHKAFVPIID